MGKLEKNKHFNRREFLDKGLRFTVAISLGGLGFALVRKSMAGETVWQLDPAKCIQCGRCADNCVVTPSAVKCVHVYEMCGYCDLCGGYFRPEARELTTAAENQLCPTGAITRTFIEEPFFRYDINVDLCIGCGKCVKGCSSFGNGSLQLQVNHDICKNCNECAIARSCPADAFQRVPASQPNIFKGFSGESKGLLRGGTKE